MIFVILIESLSPSRITRNITVILDSVKYFETSALNIANNALCKLFEGTQPLTRWVSFTGL